MVSPCLVYGESMFAPCMVVGRGLALLLLVSERSLVAFGTILATRKSTFAFCKRDFVLQGLLDGACNIYPAWSCLLSDG
jgi:hypothetical protein